MAGPPERSSVQPPAAESTVPSAATPAAQGQEGAGAEEPLDCTRGESLFKTLVSSFSRARSPDGAVLCVPLAQAARIFIPVYATIFGEGIVATRLEKDLDNSTSRVTDAAEALEAANPALRPLSVEALIREELKKYGLSFIRKDSKNGVKNLLWMKRAVDFIITLLHNIAIANPDQSTKQCSTEAYNKILLPYHGFLVSNIVSLAFNLCPTREEFCHKLGFPDSSCVKERVAKMTEVCRPQAYKAITIQFRNVCAVYQMCRLCRPLLDDVSTKLEENNCNFPDKV